MKRSFLVALCTLTTATCIAQVWSPAIRTTEKSGIIFWQNGLLTPVLKDKVADSVLGFRMYARDTSQIVAYWNFRNSNGKFGESFIGDFDKNGFTDVVAQDVMYLNAATSSEQSYPIPGMGRPTGFADVDGDGVTDVLTGDRLYFADGSRPLSKRKIMAHPLGEVRPDYQFYYLDTLGGKVVFLTSWGIARPEGGSNQFLAVEELSPEALHNGDDTVRVRTLHQVSYPSESSGRGKSYWFIFDDQWYMFSTASEIGKNYFSVTIDTITNVTPDETFVRYNGTSIPVVNYRNSMYTHGGDNLIVDGKRPCVISAHDATDTSWTLRYVQLYGMPNLRAKTLGVLNKNKAADGSSVPLTNAQVIPDADGDGLEEVLFASRLYPDVDAYSGDLYLTSGNLLSTVVLNVDTSNLPVALKTEGGWYIRQHSLHATSDVLTYAHIYTVDGRLVATSEVYPRPGGVFVPQTSTLQGLMICVVGQCAVRLQ